VKIVKSTRFSKKKSHCVAEIINSAARYVDPQTKLVYTNGHLHIPVGIVGADGQIINKISNKQYKEMGLL
jgi:hypothetical protein